MNRQLVGKEAPMRRNCKHSRTYNDTRTVVPIEEELEVDAVKNAEDRPDPTQFNNIPAQYKCRRDCGRDIWHSFDIHFRISG